MEKHLPIMNSVVRSARRAQVVVLVALALFFAFPIISMVLRYVRTDVLFDTLTAQSLRTVWWFTFWQATASTALTLLIALPFTWAVSRHQFPFARMLTSLITVPFLMPAVVVATGMKALLPNAEVPAILWAHVVFNVAVVVRMVGPQWALLDPTLEDTAADLGAGRYRTFVSVVFPHIRHSLRHASGIVFLFCFTSFAVVAILGGISHRTIESEIFIQAVRLGDVRTATSLAVLQAITVIIVLRLSGSSHSDISDSVHIRSGIAQTSGLRPTILLATFLPLAIVLTPLFSVALRSFTLNGHISLSGYRWLFDGSTSAVGINIPHTLVTSLLFAVMCAVITTPAAVALSSARNNTSAIPFLTALPLTISAVTLGLGLFITFDSSPFNWRSQWWLIPVIHSVLALPLAVRTILPATQSIPFDLYEASASLGAGPWRTWLRVEVPLIRPAIVKSAGFAAAVSLGEFGATSFLSRGDTTTIPIAIAQLLGRPGDMPHQSAFALATLVMLVIVLIPQVRFRRQ